MMDAAEFTEMPQEEQRKDNPAAHVQAVRGDAIHVEGLRCRDMDVNENK